MSTNNSYSSFLRISPNLINGVEEDDPTDLLLNGTEIVLSDSAGKYLPVSFVKSSNDNDQFVIIKTKTSSKIVVESSYTNDGTLSTNSLKVNELNYPTSTPSKNSILGISANEAKTDLQWINFENKFDEIFEKITNKSTEIQSVQNGIIIYHAMPYKRFLFHKKYENIDLCKDYQLCDGKNETPNLMREQPTFIRGLNFAHAENEYISDEEISLDSLSEDTSQFLIGYCIEDYTDKVDVHGNSSDYFPKNITECKLYEGTFQYLHGDVSNHTHLLFSRYSPTTDNPEEETILTTGKDERGHFDVKTIESKYKPMFVNCLTEDWKDYCFGETNYFHGLQPIPTAGLMVKTGSFNYRDINGQLHTFIENSEKHLKKINEAEGGYPIARTGFVPFNNIHYSRTRHYTGKYNLYGIENNTDTSYYYKHRFNGLYIWRSMTSLPLLHPEKLGDDDDKCVSDIMRKEMDYTKPNPTFINLLPLIKHERN